MDDSPDQAQEAPRTTDVYCLLCEETLDVDSPTVLVEFAPMGARLSREGSVDLGGDWWLDYWHMTCGTKTRIHMVGAWREAGASPESSLELLVETDMGLEHRDGGPFQIASLAETGHHEEMVQTLFSLVWVLSDALAAFKERLG